MLCPASASFHTTKGPRKPEPPIMKKGCAARSPACARIRAQSSKPEEFDYAAEDAAVKAARLCHCR